MKIGGKIFLLCFLCACSVKSEKNKVKLESYAKYGEFFVFADESILDDRTKQTFLEIFSKKEDNLLPPKPNKYLPRFLALNQLGNYSRRYFNSIVLLDEKTKNSFLAMFPQNRAMQIKKKLSDQKSLGIVLKDLWAKPQKILIIYEKNKASLRRKLIALGEEIFDYVEFSELTLGEEKMFPQGKPNNPSYKSMKNQRKFALPLHPYYRLAINNPEMIWCRRNSKKMDYAICIYEEPYRSEEQLKVGYIKKLRNQKTKKFLHGQLPNTYVEIDSTIPISIKKETFRGLPTIKIKGWWSMKNDFMAGPFFTRTILDKKNHRVVTIDGHLYGPQIGNKINYLRELEVYINTFEPSL